MWMNHDLNIENRYILFLKINVNAIPLNVDFEINVSYSKCYQLSKIKHMPLYLKRTTRSKHFYSMLL